MLRFQPLTPVAAMKAKRAAKKGDHVRALASCSRPPVSVLSSLGLHLSVIGRNKADTLSERFCMALAQAELGNTRDAEALMRGRMRWLRPADRTRLLLAIGRWSPAGASSISCAKNELVQCALALAAGDFALGSSILAGCDGAASADGLALGAALAAAAGDHRAARWQANRIFKDAGLSPPLYEDSDEPISLPSFTEARADAQRGALVSVVMPAHNAAATIACAIGSVLRQSWQDIELIVVDDGSTDGTLKAAREACGGDERCRIVQMPARGGAYAARNFGMDAACGSFITFNDADDWSHPERVSHGMAPLLANRRLFATQSRLIRLGPQGQFTAPRVFPLIRANPSSILFRRDGVLEALGGFEEVEFGADEEFAARLIARFGPASVRRSNKLLAVASASSNTLTGSVTTGVQSVGGHRKRLAYREDWHGRHLETFRAMVNRDRTGDRGAGARSTWRVERKVPR